MFGAPRMIVAQNKLGCLCPGDLKSGCPNQRERAVGATAPLRRGHNQPVVEMNPKGSDGFHGTPHHPGAGRDQANIGQRIESQEIRCVWREYVPRPDFRGEYLQPAMASFQAGRRSDMNRPQRT